MTESDRKGKGVNFEFLKQMLYPFKPVLVPVWNCAHQTGYWLAEQGGALASGRLETCVVCGKFGPLIVRTRAVPEKLKTLWELSARQGAALTRKEGLLCTHCQAKLRCMRISEVILELFPAKLGGPAELSIAAWVATQKAQGLTLAEFNRIDGLHEQLVSLPGLQYSEFFEGVIPGQTVQGIRCEDLTHLTYADEQFDLVLSSETLEHVPDLAVALQEIARVLRPGGYHIFTIPRRPDVARSFTRAQHNSTGALEILVPPLLHHPGGDTGYPVFTEFGADVASLFEAAGFDAEERFGPLTDDNFAQVWVTRKRSQP